MSAFIWIYVMLAVMIGGLVLIVVAITVASSSRRLRSTEPERPSLAEAARSHALRIHIAAWCALLVAAVAVLAVGSAADGLEAGRITGLVLAAGGLAFLTVSALGEVTWPRPGGTVRTATLTRRTVTDVTPRPAAALLTTASTLLVVALLVGGLTASADGRSYGRSETASDGTVTSWATGPYPGWFYALPLLLAAGAILVAGLGCLVLIARRPAISDTSPAWDLSLRRLSAQRALRGATLVLGGTAAPVYGLLALAFFREGPTVVAVVFLLGVLASIGVAATALALPGPVVPAASGRPDATAGTATTTVVRRTRWTT